MRDLEDERREEREIPRLARFRPEPKAITLPEWRVREDGAHEVHVARRDRWEKVHPLFTASLEALRAGGGFEEAVARAVPVSPDLEEKHVRIYLRKWMLQLSKEGHVRLDFEEPPPVFEGRYRRVKELGRGGVGIAHLCVDEKTGQQVVVKHAWGWLAPIGRTDRSMREEGAILRALDHPGIPPHLDEFDLEGVYHMVRGFVAGEPVLARVQARGVPPPEERRSIVLEAADIVAHLHAKGYLFLDPTPGNFVIDASGRIQVIDVGICRRHEGGRALRHGQAGSRGYAAPEVVQRDGVGVWSDVYSLGALYQYLLSGRQPPHQCDDARRAQELDALPATPAERALVLDATRVDPAARPTMDALLARLRALP